MESLRENMENMGKTEHFWGNKTTKLYIFLFWKSSILYKKISSQGDFPRRYKYSNASEYKSRNTLAQRPRSSPAYKWRPAEKPVFQIPRYPDPFHWVQKFVRLLLKRKWEKFIAPFVRIHGRKVEHPPGARGGKWSCCKKTTAASSFTPKLLSFQ